MGKVNIPLENFFPKAQCLVFRPTLWKSKIVTVVLRDDNLMFNSRKLVLMGVGDT